MGPKRDHCEDHCPLCRYISGAIRGTELSLLLGGYKFYQSLCLAETVSCEMVIGSVAIAGGTSGSVTH